MKYFNSDWTLRQPVTLSPLAAEYWSHRGERGGGEQERRWLCRRGISLLSCPLIHMQPGPNLKRSITAENDKDLLIQCYYRSQTKPEVCGSKTINSNKEMLSKIHWIKCKFKLWLNSSWLVLMFHPQQCFMYDSMRHGTVSSSFRALEAQLILLNNSSLKQCVM